MEDRPAALTDEPHGQHEAEGRPRRRLGLGRGAEAFPAKVLQLLGLLIGFVLLVAASGFAGTHPVLTAVLVFVFSLPYLLAAVATRQAHFLYATMLLGAASYFLACHALGAPGASFPVLSVPLVVCLWIVGEYLKRRLPAERASFPRTVFRAMNITVGVFTLWALVQARELIEAPGPLRYVAGVAFLGYAALYLLHCLGGAPAVYAYVFSLFLALGGILFGLALWSPDLVWAPALAAAAVALFVGTELHRDKTYRRSRHFYLSGAICMAVALGLSLIRLSLVPLGLSLASLALWVTYGRLAEAVGDVRRATTAERAVAKAFFVSSLALSAPLALLVLVCPALWSVAAAALLCGLVWAWVSWRRRDARPGGRNPYVLPAMMLLSAGVLGIGRQLPGSFAAAWSLLAPLPLMVGLGMLCRASGKAGDQGNRKSLARAAIFPAFFAWYVPLLAGEPGLALACAAVAVGGSLTLAVRAAEPLLRFALGPAGAGAIVAGALLWAGSSVTAWVLCAAAAALAGAWFVWADVREREATRGATNLAWLILSAAAATLALAAGPEQALYGLTALGFVSVLMAGRLKSRDGRDVFGSFVVLISVLATAAAVALGPLSGSGLTGAGLCLLILALAYGVAWGCSRAAGYARAAQGLFALAAVLLIFGGFPDVGARLALGALVVTALFVLAALARSRFPEVARSSVVVGHVTSGALACAALVQAWPSATANLPLAVVPYVLLYGLMPRLRKGTAFRLGTAWWLSLLAVFALAVHSGTAYREQLPIAALLSLMWVVLGYLLRRTTAGAWSLPLYVCGAVLAGFCGAVSLFTPASGGSWGVFLVNGIVFATLFLILRAEVFAYLLTLSLSLMAYDWVKASTSPFTQDLLFYLVIGAAVLGVFFLLPYLKRLVGRLGVLPMVGVFTWRGAALVSVPVLGVAALVLSAYSVKITEHPRFCISCHYMGDYYESWQHSSHKNVACVKCHYAPGPGAEIQGKMAGMVQLVKYVSHTYGTKPHAQISNESCMRPACHAEMDRSKETLVFRGKIRFRHDKHLSTQPRGKVLNCVSCHGQVVEGQHISVSETACLTCHFYGRGDAPVAVGTCQTCHVLPEGPVVFMGQPFDHKSFLADKKDVQCTRCHSGVTEGDGHVTPTRCRSCHLKSTMDIGDQAQFHLVHVSKGHFDCLQCHDEIKHGDRSMAEQMLTSGDCATCHGDARHTIQERVYAGTAVPEVESIPDVMYEAGVACDGCHTHEQVVTADSMTVTTRVSGGKECVSCHDNASYAGMLAGWQADVKDRLDSMQAALDKLEEACRSAAAPQQEEAAKALALLAAARAKLSVVALDGSDGAHNMAYVSAILDSAEAELDRCRALAARWRSQNMEPSAQ